MLELWDAALINWLLPVTALLLSQVVAWILDDRLKRAEFQDDKDLTGEVLYRHWIFMLRFVAPPIVILALVMQVAGFFVSLQNYLETSQFILHDLSTVSIPN